MCVFAAPIAVFSVQDVCYRQAANVTVNFVGLAPYHIHTTTNNNNSNN